MEGYVSVKTILAKFSRDLKDESLSEGEVIDRVGEALGFMKVAPHQEQVIKFLEVKDYHADLPQMLVGVLQIARDNQWEDKTSTLNCEEDTKDIEEVKEDSCGVKTIALDCNGRPLSDEHIKYYAPNFEIRWSYSNWVGCDTYRSRFTPVRLADHTFFGKVVCEEQNTNEIYSTSRDEYTIVGLERRKFRTSFRSGMIAVSYLRTPVDGDGYPLIPDNMSAISAITYYIKWKLAEGYAWKGREGFVGLSREAERLWLRYCKQYTNNSWMPKSIDDFQDLSDQTHVMIPKLNKHLGYFGNLNSQEIRPYSQTNRLS